MRSARLTDKAGSGNGWRQRAACRDVDPVLFFGPAGEKAVSAYIRETEAVAFCNANCPVISQCLEWALQLGEAGVWGATTEDERKALKRRQQRAALRAAAKAAT
ncbi:WhiB family transcriptional regulator [Nonomuraea sp. NPDC050227]|uniref:WhiB family transcriptional regulator n=1 Tax=Nonomuraea sp. NPDC050227 TaxID=3364360 RepID=UPI0037BD9BDD